MDVNRAEGPSVGVLSAVLSVEDFSPHTKEEVLEKRISLYLSKGFIHDGKGTEVLLRANQRLSTFCRKKCLEGDTYWLHSMALLDTL